MRERLEVVRPRRADSRRDDEELALVPPESETDESLEDRLDADRLEDDEPKLDSLRDVSAVLEFTLEFVSRRIISAVLRTF